jgi:hypothetical protein
VAWKRTAPFVLTADFNPAVRKLDDLQLRLQLQHRERQLLLFDAASSALSGEV